MSEKAGQCEIEDMYNKNVYVYCVGNFTIYILFETRREPKLYMKLLAEILIGSPTHRL
jgi:hypothetical protein